MEMKEIVLGSYELLVKLPSPTPPKSERDKYEIASRNKLKTLPEALRENSDDAANITHFVKYASYFLPRAERSEREERIMLPFLDLLLNKVKEIENKESDPKKAVQQLKYLIGYTNWNADAVCAIFTASKSDDEIKRRLQTMLGAELDVIGAKDSVDKIISEIMIWKRASTGEYKQHGRR